MTPRHAATPRDFRPVASYSTAAFGSLQILVAGVPFGLPLRVVRVVGDLLLFAFLRSLGALFLGVFALRGGCGLLLVHVMIHPFVRRSRAFYEPHGVGQLWANRKKGSVRGQLKAHTIARNLSYPAKGGSGVVGFPCPAES